MTDRPEALPESPTRRPDLPAGSARLADLVARWRTTDDPRVAAATLAAVALVAGLLWYRAGLGGPGGQAAGAVPAEVAAVRAPASSTTSALPAEVAVHIAGAVRNPGLYRLAAGSRVADAIDAAGGSAPRADLDRLNLAARLADGQRIAVARVGEPAPPGPDPAAGAAPGAAGAPAEPVDLNTATPAQLEALPGVGPATAAAIVELRTRQGGFRSVRDLLRVPGIGNRRFADLEDRVRV